MADTKVNRAGEQQPVDEYSRYSESAAQNDKSQAETFSSLPNANEIVKNYERRFGEIQQSGAQSGALDPLNPKDKKRIEKHAEITYERIRRTTDDVDKIAKATGYTREEIRQIKNHLFYNEYELADGKHRFYPDFEQAQSWDRLQRGEGLPHDKVMLQHELIESELMAGGLSYEDAHARANETANYQQALMEYQNGLDKAKKKRN